MSLTRHGPALDRIVAAVDEERLVDTAMRLIAVPSPTGDAGAAADCLASILVADGFAVERPVADWPQSPAVVARLAAEQPGPVLQFDTHLDTVHLPFAAPQRDDAGMLTGSGAADMKGGIAAAVEALRVLRESGALRAGAVLFTAHDHHEAPWGDGRQMRALIRAGIHGDAALLPEYLGTPLPLQGRGMATFAATLSRAGDPVHEVLRPRDLPDVIGAGAAALADIGVLAAELAGDTPQDSKPHAADSVFVGQVHGGEIYNQSPTELRFEGTRRWLRPGVGEQVLEQLRVRIEQVARRFGVSVAFEHTICGEAFQVAAGDPLTRALLAAYDYVTGNALPLGAKPFVDDGNRLCFNAGIPALTHGPAATGAHTTHERVAVSELLRVARVYAATALDYCNR